MKSKESDGTHTAEVWWSVDENEGSCALIVQKS
jgi:hypothetical protein